jgi:hypothetical protein
MYAARGPINEPLKILERPGYNNPLIGRPETINKTDIRIMKGTDRWTTLSKR